MRYPFLVLALCTHTLWAALSPSIPRASTQKFVSEGLFEGGKNINANLESLRFSSHPKAGYERWVIDFSDAKLRTVGTVAPLFQLRYVKADAVNVAEGKDIILDNPRFVFSFRAIHKNFLSQEKLRQLSGKSQFVKDIILYPAIEQGDTAIEFILRENVLFEPHQPLQQEGRLVLDLKKPAKD